MHTGVTCYNFSEDCVYEESVILAEVGTGKICSVFFSGGDHPECGVHPVFECSSEQRPRPGF